MNSIVASRGQQAVSNIARDLDIKDLSSVVTADSPLVINLGDYPSLPVLESAFTRAALEQDKQISSRLIEGKNCVRIDDALDAQSFDYLYERLVAEAPDVLKHTLVQFNEGAVRPIDRFVATDVAGFSAVFRSLTTGHKNSFMEDGNRISFFPRYLKFESFAMGRKLFDPTPVGQPLLSKSAGKPLEEFVSGNGGNKAVVGLRADLSALGQDIKTLNIAGQFGVIGFPFIREFDSFQRQFGQASQASSGRSERFNVRVKVDGMNRVACHDTVVLGGDVRQTIANEAPSRSL